MKLVRFTKDMAPHKAGDKRLVPDDVASRLEEAGEVDDVQPFPVVAASETPRKRPLLGMTRPGKTYETRSR
jgi:hypothetical protein